MHRALVIALALLAGLAGTASAQSGRYDARPSRARLSPEKVAEHDARMAALQARCDEVGRERCLEEDRARRESHLRDVTRENVVVVLGTLALGLAALAWARARTRRRSALTPAMIRAAISEEPPWDLAAIDIAIEARQVKLVRRNLDAILAAHPDPHSALPDVARALASITWSHVALRQWPESDPRAAQERHRALRAELLGRDGVHVPRDPGRGYRGEAAREEAQLALVSLLVLARAELPEQVGPPAEAARAALERIARVPTAEIVAVDVVWYPSEAGEAARASEVLARAPRMVAAG